MESVFIFVREVELATRLRQNRLLTSSLKHEPTFKHDDPDEESSPTEFQSKKARKIARFDFEKLLPLLLTVEEATLAVELGWITLKGDVNHPGTLEAISCTGNLTNNDGPTVLIPSHSLQGTRRIKVFKDIWNPGLCLVDGLKFGVNYLAYADDPLRSHAHYMVLIVDDEDKITVNDLIGLVTVAVKARKTLLVASENNNNGKIEYTRFQKQQLISRQERFGARSGDAIMSEDELLEQEL